MSKRTNRQWLEHLQGEAGYDAQQDSFRDLGKYLFKVGYNYLRNRRSKGAPIRLTTFDDLALESLAEDFIQGTIEKLYRNNCATLQRFDHDRGTQFTSWVSVVHTNEIRSELRRPYWHQFPESLDAGWDADPDDKPHGQTYETIADSSIDSADNAILVSVMGDVENCIEELAERRQVAFKGCVIEGMKVQMIADRLDSSANAVYGLVLQAKRQLRRCLEAQGWNEDVLDLFSQTR